MYGSRSQYGKESAHHCGIREPHHPRFWQIDHDHVSTSGVALSMSMAYMTLKICVQTRRQPQTQDALERVKMG